MAELPNPCRGIDSSSPPSPQHISMIESTEARLEPVRVPVSGAPAAPSAASAASSASSVRRTPEAPAPLAWPDSDRPSTMAASMSSSLGYSCSARSYLRELGRSRFIATWWALPISGRNLRGGSRLIIWCLLASDQDASFQDCDRPQVAVPPFHRVLLDEAVAAEQLDPVVADLHAAVGAQP